MITKVFYILTFFSVYSLNAQNVTTVTQGSFHDGLEIDSQGNLYGSDFSGDSVYKYDTSGNVTVFKSGFLSPNGIGIDPAGDIYICDHFANTIFKYDEDGALLHTYVGLTTPAGIKHIPGTNTMLIVEYNTSTVKLLNIDDDSITLVYSGLPINGPAGIAFVDGQTFIGNFNDRRIIRLVGNTAEEIAQLPAEGAQSNFLGFLSAYNGNLFSTQLGEGRIYKTNPNTGETTVFAGSDLGNDDGPLSSAKFNQPNGIIADATNDKIYISDASTKNLRVISDVNLGTNDVRQAPFVFSLYPNPSISSIKVQFNEIDDMDNAKITIFNVSGLKVFQDILKTNLSDEINIDVSFLQQGSYILTISKLGKTHSAQFTK